MDKFAQAKRKRRIGFFNELNEDYGPGKLVEKYHETMSPGSDAGEFGKLMEVLREVDGEVREIQAPLKNIMKAARSAFNRREYIACVTYLSQYHDGLEQIFTEFAKLGKAVDFKHNEFLFDGLDDGVLDYFKNQLPKKFQPKTKTAGLSDWWDKLTFSKGRALKAWEARFPKFAKKFKGETEKLLTRSEALQQSLTLNLKAMANLRASRKLEEYLDTIGSIQIKYKEFDKAFESYYNGYVKKFIADQQAYAPEEVATQVEEATQEVANKVEEAKTVEKEKGVENPFKPMKGAPPQPERPFGTKEQRPGTAPAQFPDEDEDMGDPVSSRLDIPGITPSQQRAHHVVEDFEMPINSEDILPPSSSPKGRRILELLDQDAPSEMNVDKSHSGERSTLVVPEFVSKTKNQRAQSFPPQTEGIPGQMVVREPFGTSPSAYPQSKPAPSNRHVSPVHVPSNYPTMQPEPYRVSPSAYTKPGNDVVAPKIVPANDMMPTPANDMRQYTIPAGQISDDEFDSVPVPPVRPASFPAAPQGGISMPLIPKSPGVPRKTSNVNQFLEELSKFSNKNPLILANKIVTFASDLEDSETKNKLLNIAAKLLK